MIRVVLPHHLRALARASDGVQLEVASPVTTSRIHEALAERYPGLCGVIPGHGN